MIHSRLFGRQILTAPLATVLVTLIVSGAVTAWVRRQPPGAVPASKLSETEKARRLAERDRYNEEATKLAEAGNLEETMTAFGMKLAIEREVLGELHEDVVGSLEYLARLHELGKDRAAARKALAEVLSIRERQPDRKDWRIGDVRRALADLDRRAAAF